MKDLSSQEKKEFIEFLKNNGVQVTKNQGLLSTRYSFDNFPQNNEDTDTIAAPSAMQNEIISELKEQIKIKTRNEEMSITLKEIRKKEKITEEERNAKKLQREVISEASCKKIESNNEQLQEETKEKKEQYYKIQQQKTAAAHQIDRIRKEQDLEQELSRNAIHHLKFRIQCETDDRTEKALELQRMMSPLQITEMPNENDGANKTSITDGHGAASIETSTQKNNILPPPLSSSLQNSHSLVLPPGSTFDKFSGRVSVPTIINAPSGEKHNALVEMKFTGQENVILRAVFIYFNSLKNFVSL